MQELFRPKGYGSIRKANDNNQQNGIVYNPPRFPQIGGFSSGSKMNRNKMVVEKPNGKKVI